jgi:hypothetical protein
MGCFITRIRRADQPAAWPLGGGALPGLWPLLAAGAVGFAGYSVSIALFVVLRGVARTGGYFSTAAFLGAFASVIFHS